MCSLALVLQEFLVEQTTKDLQHPHKNAIPKFDLKSLDLRQSEADQRNTVKITVRIPGYLNSDCLIHKGVSTGSSNLSLGSWEQRKNLLEERGCVSSGFQDFTARTTNYFKIFPTKNQCFYLIHGKFV